MPYPVLGGILPEDMTATPGRLSFGSTDILESTIRPPCPKRVQASAARPRQRRNPTQ